MADAWWNAKQEEWAGKLVFYRCATRTRGRFGRHACARCGSCAGGMAPVERIIGPTGEFMLGRGNGS